MQLNDGPHGAWAGSLSYILPLGSPPVFPCECKFKGHAIIIVRARGGEPGNEAPFVGVCESNKNDVICIILLRNCLPRTNKCFNKYQTLLPARAAGHETTYAATKKVK